MQSLQGYTPEKPSEGGFEPFKYTGPCVVSFARIEKSQTDSDFYPLGCNIVHWQLEVLDGEFKGRKLWKRFNIDTEKADGKGKTPVRKLADQLFAVGLEFNDMESLEKALEKFVDMTVDVKAWAISFKDKDEKVQAHNLKGISSGDVPSSSSKSLF